MAPLVTAPSGASAAPSADSPTRAPRLMQPACPIAAELLSGGPAGGVRWHTRPMARATRFPARLGRHHAPHRPTVAALLPRASVATAPACRRGRMTPTARPCCSATGWRRTRTRGPHCSTATAACTSSRGTTAASAVRSDRATSNRVGIDAFVEDAVAVLDDAACRACPALGWSIGVNTSFELAVQHPERVSGILAVAGVPGATFTSVGAPLLIPRFARRPVAADGDARRSAGSDRISIRSPRASRWARRRPSCCSAAD